MIMVMSILAIANVAQEVPLRNVFIEDSSGIAMAVLRGDAASLKRIGDSKVNAKFAALAGYHRVRGEISKSNHMADSCMQEPAVVQEKTQVLMYLCQSLRAGNRLILGDIQGWAIDMLKVRSIYRKHIEPTLDPGQGVFEIIKPEFEKFSQWPSTARLNAQPTPGLRLPLLPVSLQMGVPVISGKILSSSDGKQLNADNSNVDFIIDTGAARSTINREMANKFGLSATEGFASGSFYPNQPSVSALTAPVELKLGELHFKNVSFTIVEKVEFATIGLDLLRHMGSFAIKANEIELLQTLPSDTCPQSPTTTSTLFGGIYSLRVPLQIGDKDALVLFDTGSDFSLEVAGINLESWPQERLIKKTRVTLRGEQLVNYTEATSEVSLNGRKMNMEIQISDQKAKVFLPVSWTLGGSLLESYDYYVDVAAGRGCIALRNLE